MNIASMLARLQANLDLPHLAEQLLLIPPRAHHLSQELSEINLLVGYSNSENSQSALDLTLWIALQTRLVTSKPVTVQVAYVAPEIDSSNRLLSHYSPDPLDTVFDHHYNQSPGGIATLKPRASAKVTAMHRAEQFEQADRVLWQARSIASEWRGSLKTHLRFGDVTSELSQVAQSEAATLLIVGCHSPNEHLINRLGSNFPCPVLGIPQATD